MPDRDQEKQRTPDLIEKTAEFRSLCCAVSTKCAGVTETITALSPDVRQGDVIASTMFVVSKLETGKTVSSDRFRAIYRLIAAETLRALTIVAGNLTVQDGMWAINRTSEAAIDGLTMGGFCEALRAAGWVTLDSRTMIALKPSWFGLEIAETQSERKRRMTKERVRRHRSQDAAKPQKSVTSVTGDSAERYIKDGKETFHGNDLRQDVTQCNADGNAADVLELSQGPNWMVIQAEFLKNVWNQLPGGKGHVAKHNASLTIGGKLDIEFRDVWKNDVLRERVPDAIEALRRGLQNGVTMSLSNFLKPGTIDKICDGVYDFDDGRAKGQESLVSDLAAWGNDEVSDPDEPEVPSTSQSSWNFDDTLPW